MYADVDFGIDILAAGMRAALRTEVMSACRNIEFN